MKLKQLLKETKVWERKFGESLPTLEDTTKAYKLKVEQQFKAKSKETGRVVVYKSKDAMDKAIKGGTAEPLDKKTSNKTDGGKPEKVKGQNLFKKIDVVGKDKIELGTKVKDGKIKSSGPQRFADDVKDMKGEYDLDGGVKIKDGKMFNADGEEMDADDIEDFYYQDAYDGMGINVGIDIKKTSKPEKDDDEPEEPYDLSDFDPREDVKKNESLDEQGILSKRAGINVFGDRKLQLMAKGLRQSAFDLEKVAKRKDERNFDHILQRITITLGVMRSYLNKPKRSM